MSKDLPVLSAGQDCVLNGIDNVRSSLTVVRVSPGPHTIIRQVCIVLWAWIP